MKNSTRIRKVFLNFFLLVVFSLLLTPSLIAQTTSLVRLASDGVTLIYTPNAQGDVIPDFSGVGYKNSEELIPNNVPVKRTLSVASGDNTSRIQTAINEVAAMPLDANGFRGAVLLNAGSWVVNGTINITKSGVVLYGKGTGTGGTELYSSRTSGYDDMISIKGPGTYSTDGANRATTSTYVPIGSKKLTLTAAHPYKVGDWVQVRHVVTQAWIALLGMDKLHEIGLDQGKSDIDDWTVDRYTYNIERQIKKIEAGNVIILDAPLCDPVDSRYGKVYVSKITSFNRIENIGVENIKFRSTYSSSTDVNHVRNAITISNAKNVWVRKIDAYYHAYSAVRCIDGSIFVTVDQCRMIEPKSPEEGGNRYPFVIEGTRCLFSNCYAKNGRHDFAQGSGNKGPNVVTGCTSEDVVDNCDIGPHHRWCALQLFDGSKTNMDANVQNRGISGTGHGWAGAQVMFWNCEVRRNVIQDPPGPFTNWSIGVKGTITNCAQYCNLFPENIGYVGSAQNHITAIPSLFQAQLRDRLNDGTVKQDQTITFPALPSKVVGDADFNAGATASSGLAVSYSSSNTAVATIVGGNIHIVAAGTTTITASQAGNATFNAATSKSQTLTVTTSTPSETWYKIKVVNNPTFVLNAAGTPANGTNVNVYTYNGSDAQLWQLIDVGSGYVKIVPRSNPAYGLDCSTTPANGVNVQLWSYSGNTRQQWLKTDMGGGNNKITVRADAAFGLDCSATPANNINVQMWTYSGNNRQQWILESVLKSGEIQPEASSVLSLTCTPTYVTESAVISYAVAQDALTSVVVYNMFGQKVKDFGANYQQAGEYKITLDVADLTKGMYIIKLRSGKSEKTCKIIK